MVLIWEACGCSNWMVLSVQREGTGFKNPENKCPRSFFNSQWFKCCLYDSVRMWEFVCFHFLFFLWCCSHAFSWPFSTSWGVEAGRHGLLLVSQKASTALLTQYAWAWRSWSAPGGCSGQLVCTRRWHSSAFRFKCIN